MSLQTSSDAVHAALKPLWEKLSTILAVLTPQIEAHLQSHHRSRLAKLVAKLPDTADTVYQLAQNDLQVSSMAFGLAAAYLCKNSGEVWADVVRYADVALIMLGVQNVSVLLDVIRELQQVDVVPRMPLDGRFDAGCKHVAESESRWQDCGTVLHTQFSPEQFERFFKADQPLIIRGMAAEWPATKKWRSPHYLSFHHGHRTVPIEHTAENNMTERFMYLHQVLRHMLDSSDSSQHTEKVYLAQHPLLDYLPALADDISHPPYLTVAKKSKADLINLWLGSRTTGSKLHFDSADNFLVQIVGEKRLILIPPTETHKLYVEPGERNNISPINVDQPDLQKYPLFNDVKGLQVYLHPGDAVYIPAGYWHYVQALSASISVNFWF